MVEETVLQDEQQEIYKQLGYTSQPFPYTRPIFLEAHARLMGLNPPDAKSARILELGSTFGGNIISQAVYHPEATFIGAELSTSQVEVGQAIIKEIGLPNVTLVQKDICDITKDFGIFDYIIVHGTYSWVNDQVKDHILRICQENLADNGIAYVSYNTYPGWHTMNEVRQLMLFANDNYPDLNQADKVKRGKYISSLVGAQILNYDDLKQKNSKFLSALRSTLQKDDYYVGHDHLEPNNDPVYFHQFVKHLEKHGLAYVCDADLTLSLVGPYDTDMASKLDQLAPNNQVGQEQYLDFMLDTQFRKSIICKASQIRSDKNSLRTCKEFTKKNLSKYLQDFHFSILFDADFIDSFESKLIQDVLHALLQEEKSFSLEEVDATVKVVATSQGLKGKALSAAYDETYKMLLEHCVKGGIRFTFSEEEVQPYVEGKVRVPERFTSLVKTVVEGTGKDHIYVGNLVNEAMGDITEEDLHFMNFFKEPKTKDQTIQEILEVAFGSSNQASPTYLSMAQGYYKEITKRFQQMGYWEAI